MKKDHLRDYATEAYRFYARCGMPSYEELRDAVYREALESSRREIERLPGPRAGGFGDPTAQAVINAERAADAREGELLDILAVEKALAAMRPEARRAVEIVYFDGAGRELEWGEASERVHRAELEIPASERQIYYWLKKARLAFAAERSLRVENNFGKSLQ
ncbi:MAG: hypothetical protein LBJ10_08145 [Clostridiales bacterium]|jgi:hypothetical protein|nr:hypothetical protein [Clostridiales bacterium]